MANSILRRLLIVAPAIFAVILFVLPPATTQACTCIRTIDLDEERLKADLIFSGRVVAIGPPYAGTAIFQVYEVWRGQVLPRIAVGRFYGCMDMYMESGEYLVFARKREIAEPSETGYSAVSCGQTASLESSTQALAVLGAGIKPEAEAQIGKEKPPSKLIVTIVSIAALLFALGLMARMILKGPKPA